MRPLECGIFLDIFEETDPTGQVAAAKRWHELRAVALARLRPSSEVGSPSRPASVIATGAGHHLPRPSVRDEGRPLTHVMLRLT